MATIPTTPVAELFDAAAKLARLLAPAKLYDFTGFVKNGLPIDVSGIANGPTPSAVDVAAWVSTRHQDGRPWIMDLEPPSQPNGYGPGTAGATAVANAAAITAQVRAIAPNQLFAQILEFPSYGWYELEAEPQTAWTFAQVANCAPAYAQCDWTTAWGYMPYVPPTTPAPSNAFTLERCISELALDVSVAKQFSKRVLVFVCPVYTNQAGVLPTSQFAEIVMVAARMGSVDLCFWGDPANQAVSSAPGTAWLNSIVQPGGGLNF